jgi:hypothetical protein
MWQQSAANSAGIPKRLGNGCWFCRPVRTGSLSVATIGVSKTPGAMQTTLTPKLANSRARGKQGQARHPALGGGIGDLPDLSIEGGDGGRIDDDATFPIRFRIVVLHDGGRGAAH